jgi:hypothetical protein
MVCTFYAARLGIADLVDLVDIDEWADSAAYLWLAS